MKDLQSQSKNIKRLEAKLDTVLSELKPWISKRAFYTSECMAAETLDRLIAEQAWKKGTIPIFERRVSNGGWRCARSNYNAWKAHQ